MNRRSFLAAGSGLVLATLLPEVPRAGAVGATAPTPRILQARQTTAALMGEEAPPAKVWAFDGQVPGPILRVQQGEKLNIRFENRLEQASTIHWHGIRIDNAMDGVANLTQSAVPPGESFDYVFTAPDAGTFWYHPHNRSWEQVARGLYGLLIVEEAEPPAVDQDLALVFDDWRLTEDGQIHEDSLGHMMDWSHAGRLGNWLTVNGVSRPDIPVRKGERLRVRLANCCNARVLYLRFDKQEPWVIAIDGQPVPPHKAPHDAITLAPGQRCDLILDVGFDAEERPAILEVSGEEPLVAARFLQQGEKPDASSKVEEIAALPANPLPAKLDLNDALRQELLMEGGAMGRMMGARHRGKELGMRELVQAGQAWAFNGIAGMTEKPLLRAQRNRTVVIDMINDTSWPHAMHLHGHHFRVAERDGKPQRDTPWRDTELVERGERVAIAFLADNPGKWMFHCHMLEHQAAGMGTWLEVTG